MFDIPFIRLPIRNIAAVWRPLPRLHQAELLFVYPTKAAVEKVLPGCRGEPGFGFLIHIVNIHITILVIPYYGSVVTHACSNCIDVDKTYALFLTYVVIEL